MSKYEALPPCLSNYSIISELGRGAFSTVYKVKFIPNGEVFCLKKISQRKSSHKFNEVKILQSLHHIHLVSFISSFVDDNYIYIVMEYCEYGDLYTLLHSFKKRGVHFTEEVLWDIAYQTLLGLKYIHDKQIIHRDIKLLNIFMNKEKVIKIGDLGMSKLYEKKEMMQSRVGTPLYLPPELVKKEKYDYKVDVWSFGCSLYHLSTWEPPFVEENMIMLGHAIVNNTPAELPEMYSEAFKSFLSFLMAKNKENRPSALEALGRIPDKIKEKYKTKIIAIVGTEAISSAIHKNSKIRLDASQSSTHALRYGVHKHNTDIGDAGFLFKAKMRNFLPKRKSGTLFNFSMTKRMNGTQDGFFKSLRSNDNTVKAQSKTQTNFFNIHSNILTLKAEILRHCGNNLQYNIDIQKEFDNLEAKEQDKKKELEKPQPQRESNLFPVISSVVKPHREKTKETENMFRRTFTSFRSRTSLGKPLTINDID